MTNGVRFSEEEMDYLREMMNIGSGHAATALSNMLMCRIKVNIPNMYMLPVKKVPSVLENRDLPFACVRMSMFGDVRGAIFFVTSEKEKTHIIRMVEKANLGRAKKGAADISVLEEVGNIIAGAYLTAIHDFCGLNIYHSVPATASGVFQALIDEVLADMSQRADTLMVFETEFAIMLESEISSAGKHVTTFFIMIPSPESMKALVDSIKNAMPR